MKYLILLFASFSCLSYELIIDITNNKSSKGSIALAIHKDKADFSKNSKTAMFRKFISFKEIPYKVELTQGNYAISIYHDENGNKKLDTNFLGIPKESFGFSNNVMGLMGPPSFKKSKIILNENKTIKIKLKSI